MADLYAVTAWDGPDGAAARTELRAAHFAHIETILDRVVIAGPLYDDDGGFAGSLVVVRADSPADAEALFRSDPYFAGGVWDRWSINRFYAAAGEWVGGKTW
jgi:uncharacterized protein